MAQREIGRIGQYRYGPAGSGSIFFEEFLPELRGIKGVQAYTEMADNDATIGAILYAIEMLERNVEFHIEPGGDTAKDKEAAEFVESCMDDMERTWADTLSEILSFQTYGWSWHEIVYKRRVGKTSLPITNSKYDDGLIGWRKLPIRAQDTLYGWEYKDDTDDLIGMTQMPAPKFDRITIPIEKSLHFRTRSRKDNPEGRSILRTAYRAYYFKKRLEEIEGYGMERDLAGFPVLYGPEGMDLWNTEDPEMAEALGRAEYIVSSIRRDAREGLVLPGGENGWKLELVSSGSRRQFDTNAIIDRYDKRIATSVLADFVMMGQQQVGSFALADSKTRIFALAVGTYLDVICEVFNNQAIPRLIDLNGLLNITKLFHHIFVDLQTARRIDKNNIVSVLFRVGDAGLCNIDRALFIAHGEDGDIQLCAYDLQLLDRSGTVNVTGNQERAFALLFIKSGQLTGVGGFTRTLQTAHHNNCGGLGRNLQLGNRAAHQGGQFLVYDFNDLLSGNQAFQHLGANGTVSDRFDELLDHLEVYVGFQQCELDLAHTCLNVCLGELALTAEFFERRTQLIGQIIKHEFSLYRRDHRGIRSTEAMRSSTG